MANASVMGSDGIELRALARFRETAGNALARCGQLLFQEQDTILQISNGPRKGLQLCLEALQTFNPER